MDAPGPNCPACLKYFSRSMAGKPLTGDARGMADPVVERDEVVALLFNASDIAVGIDTIVRLLTGEDDGEEETDEG